MAENKPEKTVEKPVDSGEKPKNIPDKSAELNQPADQSEFQQIVAESKEAIAGTPEAPPTPGKRGRKPGSKNRPKEDGTAAAQTTGHVPVKAEIAQHLKAPLMAISQIPARNTDIPELALTADEAELCAQACDQLFSAFFPDVTQLSPKASAIIGGLVVFGLVGFSKYAIYMDRKGNKIVQKENLEPKEESPNNPPPVGVSAESYFAGRN